MLVCACCNISKDQKEFSKDSRSKSGYQSWCKACKLIGVSKRVTSPEGKASRRVWGKSDKRREYKLAYYHKNKLKYNFSRQIRHSLNGRSNKGWQVILGYSLEDLREHLSSLFEQEMSWENYGEYWHIDHIRPVCSFNIVSTVCDDFISCWCLSNLRPLTASENQRKSGKYISCSTSG